MYNRVRCWAVGGISRKLRSLSSAPIPLQAQITAAVTGPPSLLTIPLSSLLSHPQSFPSSAREWTWLSEDVS